MELYGIQPVRYSYNLLHCIVLVEEKKANSNVECPICNGELHCDSEPYRRSLSLVWFRSVAGLDINEGCGI